jgi:hypothetical protein
LRTTLKFARARGVQLLNFKNKIKKVQLERRRERERER